MLLSLVIVLVKVSWLVLNEMEKIEKKKKKDSKFERMEATI